MENIDVEKRIKKVAEIYSPIIIAFTGFFIMIAAIWGVCQIDSELDNLNKQTKLLSESVTEANKQTELLSKSITETYRPLCVLKYVDVKNPKSKAVNIRFLNDGPKDKFGFIYEPSVINISKNPLVLIGHIYSLFEERDFIRDKILSSDTSSYESIKFDGKYPEVRRRTLLSNEFETIVTRFDNIDFKQKYYLNVIILYEDLDGNLYDTECRTVLVFSEPTWSDDRLRLVVNFESVGLDFNSFFAYKKNDKEILKNFMVLRDHNMWEYFSK